MEIYIPLPMVLLACLVGTAAGLAAVARLLPARPTTGRWIGGGSLLAGLVWGGALVQFALPGAVWAIDVKSSEPSTAEQPAEAPDSSSGEVIRARGVRELGVEPNGGVGRATIDHESRPAWVESAPRRVGKLHTTAVSSGPWLSPDECRRALDEKLLEEARAYVVEQVHSPRADWLAQQYDLASVKTRLLKSENIYEEQVIGDLSGSTLQMHALLEFDDGFRSEIAQRWRGIVMQFRLVQAGLIGGGVLLILSVMLGLLRADTATRGYYTRSLQFAAAIAILGFVAAGVLLAKNFPWL